MVRLTDRPDMTLDVYRGRKTTMQQHFYCSNYIFFLKGECSPIDLFPQAIYNLRSGILSAVCIKSNLETVNMVQKSNPV